jgi:hypothetical protein
MNYTEAIDYIHSTLKFGSKLGLANISELLRLLGNPEKKFKSVHIAGTNGKGSTASYLYSVLCAAGYKTGLFISPYLERFNERIRTNVTESYMGEIENEEIAALTELIKEKIEELLAAGFRHPTEFELVTALGFLYFAKKNIDIAVVEVGLGGRFDATRSVGTDAVGPRGVERHDDEVQAIARHASRQSPEDEAASTACRPLAAPPERAKADDREGQQAAGQEPRTTMEPPPGLGHMRRHCRTGSMRRYKANPRPR